MCSKRFDGIVMQIKHSNNLSSYLYSAVVMLSIVCCLIAQHDVVELFSSLVIVS